MDKTEQKKPAAKPAETVPMVLNGERSTLVDVPLASVEQFKAAGWAVVNQD